ncbi:Exostosin family protein [Striga hermonthica]|uniref:Exostosin family protein n=1 Tax=Striga hermonthica TaxID=68872 RepID=A0A9N7R401_STRHE|nr:Exostosin family protein [Striga hermonthica]
MGNELRYVCLVETRRLLLLMGVIFGLILFIQYFELPYSNILSSLFSNGKSQVQLLDNLRNSSEKSITLRNQTYLGSVNSTDLDFDQENVDIGARNVKDDFGQEDKENSRLNNDIDVEDESRSKEFFGTDHISTSTSTVTNDSILPDEHGENLGYAPETSAYDVMGENKDTTPNLNLTANSPANVPPGFRSPYIPKTSMDVDVKAPYPVTSTGKDAGNILQNIGKPIGKEHLGGTRVVVPISKMKDLLLQSRVSYSAVKPQWSSTADQELLNAKFLVENASVVEKDPQFDVTLYRNFSEFKRSYELMEQTLKVYIYAEGEKPIFHQPPLKGIYASEGWFMKLLKSNKRFVTKNPKRAHLFYLPFSSRMLEVALYIPDSHSRDNLIQYLSDYVTMIMRKHSFWNRTDGSDHFLVACHDWAPVETRRTMPNSIRSLCNSDIKEGFRLGKDVSLPETLVRTPQNPLRQLGGKPPGQRRTLAFFAGSMHGYLRPFLLKHWENKDPDMKIFGQLQKVKGQTSYAQYMKTSKYCICARGYEVNSPRVVEAIFYECVPVIISDNFVPPFFETLNWESFAVFVSERDVPNLKKILLSISSRRYVKMQKRVREVQRHFLWHSRPEKYDVFHMILHSVWYNRVFQTRSL